MTGTKTPRFLLTVDGSLNSARAVDYLVQQLGLHKAPAEVHVLNVQAPFPGTVAMHLDQAQIEKFHKSEGERMLAKACAKLDAAGVRYVTHIGVGDPAHVIADYAKEKACDQIFMSTRGMGTISGLLLGSVATKVVHLSDVPVLLIK